MEKLTMHLVADYVNRFSAYLILCFTDQLVTKMD